MILHDPVKRAENIRRRMMKNGQYLIAKLVGSGQEPDPKKLFHTYFRYKDYIKNLDWSLASKEDVWSSKFLGLGKDNFTKLEFQNPPYCAAWRMGGDPRYWNRVFTVQLAGCNYACAYCYVPRELNAASPKFGKYFSAQKIVNELIAAKIQYKKEKSTNILRLTGGEVAIVPELIIDIYREIKSRKLSKEIYIWCDCNLSTSKFLKVIKDDLEQIFRRKNISITGCFKAAADSDDFSLITGAQPEFYNEQFEMARFFINIGADFYVYLPAIILGSKADLESKLRRFASKLADINKNLPLRVELLRIKDYPATLINKRLAAAEGRVLPDCDQSAIFELWYNKILPEMYSQNQLNKFCCQISLR